MSIFANRDTLRSEYAELAAVDISGTDETTPKRLVSTRMSSKMLSLINDTNVEVEIMIEHPEYELSDRRLLFNRLGPGQWFNIDGSSGSILKFPAKTKIYVHTRGQTATNGKFRFFVWG